MSKLTMKYTAHNVGCYGDGVLGHQHVRDRLAELIATHDEELAAALRTPGSDDTWDEDEEGALEILNDRTDDGLCWSFEGGDLVLSHIL
jgi:hypothetical protein